MQTSHMIFYRFVLSGLLLLISYTPGYSEESRLSQPVDTLSFHLPDVVVTAIEGKGVGSVSLLPSSAIEHVQPFSAADLMQLLPGGLTINSSFGQPQYFAIREITLNNGLNNLYPQDAEQVQIVLDGSPLHSNTDIGNPFSGADTRFLSMNEVEQAEVVRGIPSARYGNLTNGMLLLKTRSGKMPLTAGIRYNPNMKQYTAGKGFVISPPGHTLNLLADYTAQGNFHTGGLRLANTYHWQPGGHPLTARFDYYVRIGNLKSYASEENHIRQKLQNHRLTFNGEWKPGKPLLESLSFRADFSASKTVEDKYYVPFAQQVYTHSTVTGESVAQVLPARYICRELREGLPVYTEMEIHAITQRPLPSSGSRIELSTGITWRSEGNRGNGLQFDFERPPSDSPRPRSYKEIPFLHSGAAFAEAVFHGPYATVQAGIRYHGLGCKDYGWLGSVEPRLNLSWTAFSSSRYQLRLKGGAGLMGYMPTNEMLYPSPVYNDRTSFYYNDPKEGNSLAIVYTHVSDDRKNTSLRPTINRKFETGFILGSPLVNLDLTGFYERKTGGFTFMTDYRPYTYRAYEYQSETGLHPEYRNGQVWVNGQPVPYRNRHSFTAVSTPVNAETTNKHGVEMTADFGTFHPLLTSLVIDAQWLRISNKTDLLTAHTESGEINGESYAYVGYYDKGYNSRGNKLITEQLSTNCRFITRIPRIGLVTTLTLQMVWMQRSRWYYNDGNETEIWPVYWCGADGIRHPFTETEKADPDFSKLLIIGNPNDFLQDTYKPYGLINLRVSKEFSRYVTLSFFSNNLGDMRPVRLVASTGNYLRQNPSPFFGLEMQIKL